MDQDRSNMRDLGSEGAQLQSERLQKFGFAPRFYDFDE